MRDRQVMGGAERGQIVSKGSKVIQAASLRAVSEPLQVLACNCIIEGSDWQKQRQLTSDLYPSERKLPIPLLVAAVCRYAACM